MMMKAIKRFLRWLTGPPDADEVEWVVNDNAELGVRICGRSYFLYKGHSLVYNGNSDDAPKHQRRVQKREFGECCHPYLVNLAEIPVPHQYIEGDGWFAL